MTDDEQVKAQPSLFDDGAPYRDEKMARQVTDEAIARSDAHADAEWRQVALDSVRHVAQTMDTFVSDDVREYLVTAYPEHATHNMSALGGSCGRERSGGGWN